MSITTKLICLGTGVDTLFKTLIYLIEKRTLKNNMIYKRKICTVLKFAKNLVAFCIDL